MKFATWIFDKREEAGILSKDLQRAVSFSALDLPYSSLLDFIVNRSKNDEKKLITASAVASAGINDGTAAPADGVPVSAIQMQAPIPVPRRDIICLGLNYRDHAKEAGKFDINADEKREKTVYFSKRAVRALGPEGIIENHFDINGRLDYEAELAVIIGKDARKVRQENAWDYVFGLCCFNDISGRDLQQGHKQWYFGKSLDTFTAYGPYIATIDEFTLPLSLAVRSRINGEQRQNGNTRDMIFPVDFVIEELSAGMTLDAGTIIATGTPAGVGAAFTPHRCMKSGDVCEIEIEGCGVLRNTVG